MAVLQRRSHAETVDPERVRGVTGTVTESPSEPRHLVLAPERVLRHLLWVIGALLLLNVAGQLAWYLAPDFPAREQLVRLVWVDVEQSLPTLFSVLLLLACAAALAVVATTSRRLGLAGTGHWRALVGLFVFLALDEFLSLHEQLIDPVREALDLGGVLYYAWVVPAMVAVVVVTAVFARHVLRLPHDIRTLVLAAGAMYVIGAIAFEILATGYVLDGAAEPRPDLIGDQGLGYLPYSATEEALEMGGAALFLYALLRHLRDHLGGMGVLVSTGGRRAGTVAPADAQAESAATTASGSSTPITSRR